MHLDERKIRLLAISLILVIVTYIIIIIFVNYKLSLYFTDKYLWYVYMGYKYHYLTDISQGNKPLIYADKALNLGQNRSDVHKLRAEYYYWLSFYDKSEEVLSELNKELSILKNMNESSFYYRNMGLILREQDKLNESLHYLKKAIIEEPNSFENHLELSLVYLKADDIENALKHLNQSRFLIETQPTTKMIKDYILAANHLALGLLYLKEGLDQEADAEFKIARTISSMYYERISELISS